MTPSTPEPHPELRASSEPGAGASLWSGHVSRRTIIFLGFLAVAGCATSKTQQTAAVPEPIWPEAPPMPPKVAVAASSAPAPRAPAETGKIPDPTPPSSMETLRKGPVPYAYARRTWAKGPVVLAEVDPMLPPRWITVHHEGWTPFYASGEGDTKSRLDVVRNGHVGRGWGDIGYHFVVDRAGRVWEGRSLKYQGAHVRKCNENNIGVMCLGNFMVQDPSAAQLAALQKTVTALRSYYRIPMERVRTHREWPSAHTECPGTALQARMVAMRRGVSFA